MGGHIAKQFMHLGGKPMILHAFEAFHRFDPLMQFILVLFPALEAEWRAITAAQHFDVPHKVVHGGAERFHSVQNGLAALGPNVEYIAIHDAVRPLVSRDTIARSFEAAQLHGAAVPVVAVTDTIRQMHSGQSTTLPRHELMAVQTPQCFSRNVLLSSYNVPYEPSFTDDASVVERAGHYIHLSEGNRSNIKLTTPEDILIAHALLGRA